MLGLAMTASADFTGFFAVPDEPIVPGTVGNWNLSAGGIDRVPNSGSAASILNIQAAAAPGSVVFSIVNTTLTPFFLGWSFSGNFDHVGDTLVYNDSTSVNQTIFSYPAPGPFPGNFGGTKVGYLAPGDTLSWTLNSADDPEEFSLQLSNIVQVPEPGVILTNALVLLGVGGFGVYRHRRNAAKS